MFGAQQVHGPTPQGGFGSAQVTGPSPMQIGGPPAYLPMQAVPVGFDMNAMMNMIMMIVMMGIMVGMMKPMMEGVR
ncbi:cell division protein FtsH [Dehalococcoidia bacterium]|nr:cell division protein FtsH [Dehalococcoidia bacterium]